MNMDLAIMEYCEKDRGHPSKYTADELRMISLKIRSKKEQIKAVVQSTASLVKTELLLIKVPLRVIQANQMTCESNRCGGFSRTKHGEPICLKCGCVGFMYLRSLWSNPSKKCPEGLWDNANKS